MKLQTVFLALTCLSTAQAAWKSFSRDSGDSALECNYGDAIDWEAEKIKPELLDREDTGKNLVRKTVAEFIQDYQRFNGYSRSQLYDLSAKEKSYIKNMTFYVRCLFERLVKGSPRLSSEESQGIQSMYSVVEFYREPILKEAIEDAQKLLEKAKTFKSIGCERYELNLEKLLHEVAAVAQIERKISELNNPQSRFGFLSKLTLGLGKPEGSPATVVDRNSPLEKSDSPKGRADSPTGRSDSPTEESKADAIDSLDVSLIPFEAGSGEKFMQWLENPTETIFYVLRLPEYSAVYHVYDMVRKESPDLDKIKKFVLDFINYRDEMVVKIKNLSGHEKVKKEIGAFEGNTRRFLSAIGRPDSVKNIRGQFASCKAEKAALDVIIAELERRNTFEYRAGQVKSMVKSFF